MNEEQVKVFLETLKEWEEKQARALQELRQAEKVVSGLRMSLEGLKLDPKSELEPERRVKISRPKGIREPILRVLDDSDALTAAEIAERLTNETSIRVGRESLYQMLNRLVESKIVSRVKAASGSRAAWAYRLTKGGDANQQD
ncbi:MAG: helix-turn-helix domain-containing protein [Thermoanaerobaculaceae bacterium]|jgi:transposase